MGIMRLATAILCSIAVLFPCVPIFAQLDPCAEIGSDCRPLTNSEAQALKDRILALKAALPVPDTARWAIPEDVDEAFTMPYVAEQKSGAPMVCVSWPAGCFTEMNDIDFIYNAVKEGDAPKDKPAKKSEADTEEKSPEEALAELAASAQSILGDFGNRIEIGATLLPHAYLVYEVDGNCVDVSDPEAITIENSPTFLAWESADGTSLTMVFGPRTCKEIETLRVDKPAKTLAPVKAIVLEVIGPDKAEIAALKQKINRKAFEALLGEVVK